MHLDCCNLFTDGAVITVTLSVNLLQTWTVHVHCHLLIHVDKSSVDVAQPQDPCNLYQQFAIKKAHVPDLKLGFCIVHCSYYGIVYNIDYMLTQLPRTKTTLISEFAPSHPHFGLVPPKVRVLRQTHP